MFSTLSPIKAYSKLWSRLFFYESATILVMDRNDNDLIRNFSIIAHIDHGKSTLADRLIEYTETVSKREMTEQLLDDMDLEKEKGITIKAHPVTMKYKADDDKIYTMNFIDTPGHVDFSYEVSRSLAACEGALLILDAAQGVQAQTVANVHLAQERNLAIIPIINKIDLPSADVEGVKTQIKDLLGIDASQAILTSAKTGQGIKDVLEEIVYMLPPPSSPKDDCLSALIFDSYYDTYRGVMAYVRIISGEIKKKSSIKFMATDKLYEVTEVGIFSPNAIATETLKPGCVGYILANIKDTSEIKIGDTITSAKDPIREPLDGFEQMNPVVFAGIYPVDSSEYPLFCDALKKLQINDSALFIEPETSQVLGMGYRCGFLGLLHLEIIFERLLREFNLNVITTSPSVVYIVHKSDGQKVNIDNPTFYPDPSTIAYVEEPWVKCNIITPGDFLGPVMNLINEKRGHIIDTESVSSTRLYLHAKIPLNELITEFNDRLKSLTEGYASFDYESDSYEKSDIIKLEIKVNDEPVDAFSTMIHRSKAEQRGREICKKLLTEIPKHQFKIPIQAAIGGKIIGRETISALKKNVTAKCYGGDISRKRKLWEKQKKGKEKMREYGKVQVPQRAFISILKTGD